MKIQTTRVLRSGVEVGVAAFDTEAGLGSFQYSKKALAMGFELSPIHLPLSEEIYTFPELPFDVFKGMPGLIADSLPDDFGNAVLDAWVARSGRSKKDITPIERLQYIGSRGVGALEYQPSKKMSEGPDKIHIAELVNIAQDVLNQREGFSVGLSGQGKEDPEAMLALLSVGTSAGGARPKAVLAFNEDFSEVRSGQVDAPQGFTHYLMKFDGVSEQNKNKETFGDPMGYGAMEYVYAQIARDCSIEMSECRLLEEGDRRHFITRRFDREGNNKIHTQTLNALDHLNYKAPGTYSYEQMLAVARTLGLKANEMQQIVRQAAFNIIMRNHDDHPKNFSFQLKENTWELAPAYDLAYSYKPGSKWVDKHWMSLNGKRDEFNREDFYQLSRLGPMFNKRFLDDTIDLTIEQARTWKKRASEADVPKGLIQEVEKNQRLENFKKALSK